MRLKKFMLTGAAIIFVSLAACGTPQEGNANEIAEPTKVQEELTPTSEPVAMTPTATPEPVVGQIYVEDPTAGNIYVAKTGDTSFEVAVNLEQNTILDTIVIGDSKSMKAHNVKYNSAKMDEDLYGSKYVKLKDSKHYMSFEVKVDPKKQNYVTVKFWGGETGSNSAMILYGENTLLREQDYGSDWPLLDYLGSEPELDGGYYYATYRIPLSMSFNKETVKLELRHFGSVDAYDLNGDGIKYVETENSSRAIYQISTHTDTFYTIQEGEAVGLAEELDTSAVYTKAKKKNAYEFLLDKANAATETIIKWQLYGTEFEKNVKAGKIPEIARGCLMTGGKATDTYDMDSFASKYHGKVLGGNAEYMKMLYGMAVAYELPGNTYYHSEELLERMVAAWDFYVRAQGSNGGFANEKINWIGLSSNTGEKYDEEGRQAANTIIPAGEKAIAESFVLLYDAVAATGMLDEAIDYNLDGIIDSATETRKTAYYKMFCEGTEFAFTYNHRECVNQDLINLMMGYHFNKAADLLGDAVYSEDTVMTRLYAGLGITEHLYTKVDGTPFLHGGYQFSVKNAIAMETFGSGAGGYCGNYGFNCSSLLYDFAHVTQDEKLIEQAVKSADTLGYFIDYVMGSSGIAVLRKEDAINTRNLFTPGRVSYAAGGNNFLPVLYGSETAKRQMEIYLQSGSWLYDFPSLTDVHAADTYRHILDMLTEEGFKEILMGTEVTNEKGKITYEYDLETDCVLPTEDSYGNFVFADEMARVVVLRNGDDFIRMVLNWRMEYNGARVYENATTNDVLRVHHTTSNSSYITTAAMKSPDGFGGVYLAKYGPYTVIMNASETVTYEYTVVGDGAGVARNLATGEMLVYGSAVKLEPMSTMVIYTGEGTPEAREESAIVNPPVIIEGEGTWDETAVTMLGAGVHELVTEFDTYVHSKNITENYASEERIILGKEREGILVFDLRSVPEDAKNITLRLYSWWGGGNDLIFSIIPEYQQVTKEITYTSRPDMDDSFGTYRINSASDKDAQTNPSKAKKTEIDLTKVIAAFRDEYPEATRLVLHIANPDVSSCTEIRSTEGPGGTEYAPTLIITVD